MLGQAKLKGRRVQMIVSPVAPCGGQSGARFRFQRVRYSNSGIADGAPAGEEYERRCRIRCRDWENAERPFSRAQLGCHTVFISSGRPWVSSQCRTP